MAAEPRRTFLGQLGVTGATAVFAPQTFLEGTLSAEVAGNRSLDCPIVFIDRVTPSFGATINKTLRDGYFPIQLSEINDYFQTGKGRWESRGAKPIALVFRTQNSHELKQALGILIENSLQATFALRPDSTNPANVTNEEIKKIAEVREVAAYAGNSDHITNTRIKMRQITGKDISSLVYTPGDYDDRTIANAREFKLAVGNGKTDKQTYKDRLNLSGKIEGREKVVVNPLLPIKFGDPITPFFYDTFDDCYTEDPIVQLLDSAKQSGDKITFFPVGRAVQRFPYLWRRVYAEGHAIENHTFSHRYLTRLTDREIVEEFSAQRTVLKNILGSDYEQHFFRPPFGYYDTNIMHIAYTEFGLGNVMWTADTLGWQTNNNPLSQNDTIVSILSANASGAITNGGIIVQHGNPNDVAAFPKIAQIAKSRSIQSSTLPEGFVMTA